MDCASSRSSAARYEAELAEQRYMQVDPKNRLVADTLEADWNARLRALREREEEYEAQRRADRALVDEKSRAEILALAADFPRLWGDAKTTDRQRKQIARLLIEDVTLLRGDDIRMDIRFKGGATQSINLPLPPPAWKLRLTLPEAIAEIDRLLEDYTDAQSATKLNQQGLRTGTGGRFTRLIVRRLRENYGLTSRYNRLRKRGMLTQEEIATALDINPRRRADGENMGCLRPTLTTIRTSAYTNRSAKTSRGRATGCGSAILEDVARLSLIEPMRCKMKHNPWFGGGEAGKPPVGIRSGWRMPRTVGCRSAHHPRSR